MPKLGQRGVVHFFILLILAVGLIIGLYLVTSGNPLKLFSRAGSQAIIFKGADGKLLPLNTQGIPFTISPAVQIEITSSLSPSPRMKASPSWRADSSSNTFLSYRVAENPAELEKAAFRPYTQTPMVVNYAFSNTPGIKFIWVEFRAQDWRTERKSAQIQVVSPTPSGISSAYQMNVLVIKYFPLTKDGKNIDIAVTGDVGESYEMIRQRTIDVTINLKNALERSTQYLGYKDSKTLPSLMYNIVDTKEYTKAVPIKPRRESIRYPDYYGIMVGHNICDYVDNRGVREVWLWAYQGPNKSDGQPSLGIFESKMSSPFGDISNSGRYNDMPVCKNTYRVYTFNYQRGTSEALESWGHQMEAELLSVDGYIFRNLFQGPPYPQVLGANGRCGSVHNPPNATEEYDRDNSRPQNSDCLDWNPDNLGKLSSISCENWSPGGCKNKGDSDNPHLNYQIWNWQNLPGAGNNKYFQGKKLRNLWDIHGDFDNVMRNRTFFTKDPSTPTPTPISTPIASRYVKVISPNGGETLQRGTTYRISWESNKIDKVMIGWSTGSGSLDWISTDVRTSPAQGVNSYDWVVDTGNSTNTQFKIEIRGYETGEGSVVDQSDNFFTVINPSPSPSISPTPTSTPSPSLSPQASFKRVFVTSTTYNGNLGGLTGADTKCQERANAASLGGTWKAWLSDSLTSVSSRLNHSSVPYKLLNGIVVANGWSGLSSLSQSININEFGNPVSPTPVWTGSNCFGEIRVNPPYNITSCANWISDASSVKGFAGGTNNKDCGWSETSNYNCNDSSLHLYCFEQ